MLREKRVPIEVAGSPVNEGGEACGPRACDVGFTPNEVGVDPSLVAAAGGGLEARPEEAGEEFVGPETGGHEGAKILWWQHACGHVHCGHRLAIRIQSNRESGHVVAAPVLVGRASLILEAAERERWRIGPDVEGCASCVVEEA